jgi:indolepyruvate ferredoxin oxidoreductase alpha subunit
MPGATRHLQKSDSGTIMSRNKQQVLLGNEAIARGLVESNCQIVTSYPGTPSSEILPAVVALKEELGLPIYAEWSTNEKVAFDHAFAASITGKRAACAMKQVGLNVACDSLMSAAYQGVVGGLLVISCDDPGPHSSQTEQDSRLFAHFAKVPVFDPSTPREAKEMVATAFEISEQYRIPAILRPAIRVCHAKQNVSTGKIRFQVRKSDFHKDPQRWAATPRFRYVLHKELNLKLSKIEKAFARLKKYNFHNLKGKGPYPLGIICGGVPYATIMELLMEEDIDQVPVLKIGTPYPFPNGLVTEFMEVCSKVLVMEETEAVIELFITREKGRGLLGRFTGDIPLEGELTPERIYEALGRVFRKCSLKGFSKSQKKSGSLLLDQIDLPDRRPTLCPGCPHRAAFFAIKRAFPKAIFTSDIGCYTLGINLGSVDTVLDMGAGITMANGFFQAYHQDDVEKPIIATMGDSTFYHSGTAALINGVYNDARYILVILDNATTAMTGMQPTPGTGIVADGKKGHSIPLERIVSGCGVDYVRVHDPYDVKGLIDLLKEAHRHTVKKRGGIAVIITRRPCIIAYRDAIKERATSIVITEKCDGCGVCIRTFECPALIMDRDANRVTVSETLCCGCGVCVHACKKGAIFEK